MRRYCSTILAAAVLGMAAQIVTAAPLTNGNFETTSATTSETFTGWIEEAASLDLATVAATGLGTGNAMQINGGASVYHNTYQVFDLTTGAFTTSVQFAATDPGATNTAFRFILGNAQFGSQLNIKLMESGVVVYNTLSAQGTTGWKATSIDGGYANFSSSLSSPVVNTMTVSGMFDGTTNSYYTIQLNGSTVTAPLGYFQNGIPASFGAIKFGSDLTTGSYIVDNVSVPEPTGILAAAGSLGLLMIRRRQHA